MRQLLFILTVFIPSFLFGQLLANDVEIIGDSLRMAQTDTFFVIKNYYTGSTNSLTLNEQSPNKELFDANCENTDAIYIFYKKNGQLFIQKRNECYIYKTISTDTCNVFTFFVNNVDEIVNETIFNNSYIDRLGDTVFVSVENSNLTDLYLSYGTTKKMIILDWFDLLPTDKLSGGINKNINYDHNIKTITKSLILYINNKIKRQLFTKE